MLVTKNLNISNCIAMGTDNEGAMVGSNNGAHAKLKQENASVFLLRCVSRSIQLTVLCIC